MSNLIFKVQFGNDLRRITLPQNIATMNSLTNVLKNLYKLSPTVVLKIRYFDDEGDLIVVSSDEELKEAQMFTQNGYLKLTVEVIENGDVTNQNENIDSSIVMVSNDVSDTYEQVQEPQEQDVQQEIQQQEVQQEIQQQQEVQQEQPEQPEQPEQQPEQQPEPELEQEQKEIIISVATDFALNLIQEIKQKEQESKLASTTSSSPIQEAQEAQEILQPVQETEQCLLSSDTLSTPQTVKFESLPSYSSSCSFETPVSEKNSSSSSSSNSVTELDYLTNEFHFHRLLVATAVESSFDNLQQSYINNQPRIQEFFNHANQQRALIQHAIEATIEQWRNNINNYPPAQEISRKVSESLSEIGTFTAPVIDNIRNSLIVLLEKLFQKKSPLQITAPDVMREMDTFSSPQEQVDQQSYPNEKQKQHQSEDQFCPSESEITISSSLSDDFVYLNESQQIPATTTTVPTTFESESESEFHYPNQLMDILIMGFDNVIDIKNALIATKGDVSAAVGFLVSL